MLSKLIPISILASLVMASPHHAGLQLRHFDHDSGSTPSLSAYGGGYGGDKKKHDNVDSTTTTTSTHTATHTVYAQKPSESLVNDVQKKPHKPKACRAKKPAAAAPAAGSLPKEATPVSPATPGKGVESSPKGDTPSGYTPEEGEGDKIIPEAGSNYPTWNANTPSKPSDIAAPKHSSAKDERPHKPSFDFGKPSPIVKPTGSKNPHPSQPQKSWGAKPSASVPSVPEYGSGSEDGSGPEDDDESYNIPSPSSPHNQPGPQPSGSDYAAAPANSDLALVKPSGSWLADPAGPSSAAAPPLSQAPAPSEAPVYSEPAPAPASDSVVVVYSVVDVVPMPASSTAP